MAGESEEITTEYCTSCKQDVPSKNFEMHIVHCKRFLTSCPQCGESVNKNLLEEHIDENHAKVRCDLCGESVEKVELEDHKTSDCKKRSVTCKYCKITLPACDMSEHKESCGSRTEECDNCKRRILVKDMEGHLASGCQTAVKTNGKTERDPGTSRNVPERLIGGRSGQPRGFGFAVHPQFSYAYTNEETFNPYVPECKTSDFLNHDTPRVTPALRRAIQRTSPNPGILNPVPPPRSRLLNPEARRSNFTAKPKVENKTANEQVEKHLVQKKADEPPQKERYGIYDSDSDNAMEENTPYPDLTDDTFLPCEFCDEMFPADSLGFHQANCDNVPPTPRPFSPPKMKRLSLDPSSRAPPSEPYQDEAAAIPRNDFPFRRNSPDIGDGVAPCEFCSSSFPLVDLALHQVTCGANPNLQGFAAPEQRRYSLEEPDFEKTTLPIPHHPESPVPRVLPNNSESTRPNLRPGERQTKPTQPASSSLNAAQAREKRKLAPSFSVKEEKPASSPSSETSASTLPKNKSIANRRSTGAVDRKSQQTKRKSKPIPKKIPRPPQSFHEVNMLGGERQQNERPFYPGSFNSRTSEVPSPFFATDPERRDPLVNRSVGPSQVTNPRRNNRGSRARNSRGHYSTQGHNPARGHHSTRGYNFTRGRPYGSRTVTLPPRRANYLRQFSDIHNAERDVSSQPDLALEGQAPEFDRRRGRGQRLGSEDSGSRPGRKQFHPPRNNNWD